VLEDGHEQHINSFEEHESAEASVAAASPTSMPPNVYSNLPIYPKSTAVNVLLLDELNTPEGDLKNVRRNTLEYLGKIPPGTWLAVFALSSRLQLVSGFTTDVAQLQLGDGQPGATSDRHPPLGYCERTPKRALSPKRPGSPDTRWAR
jgi:VWFA-related protein